MDAKKINEMLHREEIPRFYQIEVGENVTIALPRLPMTRYTEFVTLEPEEAGDIDNFRVRAASPEEEGMLAPQQIEVRGIRPGTLHLHLVARDSLTGEEIPGVERVNVTVEASRD